MDISLERGAQKSGQVRPTMADAPMAVDKPVDDKIGTNSKKTNRGSAAKSNQTIANEAEASNNQPQANNEKTKSHRKRGHKKKNKSKPVDCPDKIVELVLAQSFFKVPDLSKKIDDLIKSQESSRSVKYDYKDTVPELAEKITVMPAGFEHVRVEVDPEAITQLQCIYHQAQHPMRRRKGRKNKGDRKRRLG